MKFKFTDLKKAINELNNVEGLLEEKISLAVTRKKKELTEDFCNAIEGINEAGHTDKISDFVFNFYNDNFTEEESEEVEEVEESVSEKDEIENEAEAVEELNEEIETDEDIVKKEESEINNIADELSLDSTPDIKSDEAEKEPIEIDVVPEKKQKAKKKDKVKSEKKTKVKSENSEQYTRIQAFCDALKGESKTIKEISEKAKKLYSEANPGKEQKGVERYTKILIRPLIVFGFVILQNEKYSLKEK